MTISRRTAILAELAALDERMLVADGADRDRLAMRQGALEAELAAMFAGVAAPRAFHSTWGANFRGRERRRGSSP